MSDPPWSVLLLGGAAGAGKSTAAAAIARRMNCSWISADALWAMLKAATDPSTNPALHHFEPSDEEIERGVEPLLRRHIASAVAISAPLEAFIAWQMREGERLVLEGAWITPQCAARLSERHAGACSVFIHERDPEAVLAAMMSRASTTERTTRRDRIAEMSWMYSGWLRDECRHLGLPVVDAQPRETLVQRILDAAPAPTRR